MAIRLALLTAAMGWLALPLCAAVPLEGKPKWPNGQIPVHLQLDEYAPRPSNTSLTWNDLAQEQLSAWNAQMARVQVKPIVGSTIPKRDGDLKTSVYFGSPDEPFALAVTLWRAKAGVMEEADVIFDAERQWDWKLAGGLGPVWDFSRVALHEFGHVLGLGHPDKEGQTVASVMNHEVSDEAFLTPDDIGGIQTIYGKPAPPVSATTTVLVSKRPDNSGFDGMKQITFSDGVTGTVSANGRYGLLGSHRRLSADLTAPSDSYLGVGAYHFYRRDTETGETLLVSKPVAGSAAGDPMVERAAITADGRYVFFLTRKPSMFVPERPAQANGLYLVRRNMDTGQYIVVVQNSAATSARPIADPPSITPDGKFVVFLSSAGDLVNGVGGWPLAPNLFILNTETMACRCISLEAGNTYTDTGISKPLVSNNGQIVVLRWESTSERAAGIFCFRADTGAVQRVASGSAYPGSLTPDGKFLIWDNDSSLKVSRVYVSNLQTGGDTPVDITPSGREWGLGCVGGYSTQISPNIFNKPASAISDDGRYAVFAVPDNDPRDVYVRDLVQGVTIPVSVGSDGAGMGNNFSFTPAISGDGRYVIFMSCATNLEPGVEFYERSYRIAGHYALLARDLQKNTTRVLSVNRYGNRARGIEEGYSILSDNRVAFCSSYTDLVPETTYGANLYLSDPKSLYIRSPMEVSVSGPSGAGGVSPEFLGSTVREIGALYRVTAKANPGYVFGGWYSEGLLRSNLASFEFIMEEGLRLEARFIPNPFGPLAGTYIGSVQGDASVRAYEAEGLLQIVLSKAGSFTGKLFSQNESFRLSGSFFADGTVAWKGMASPELTIRRADGSAIEVTLSLNVESREIHVSFIKRRKGEAEIASSGSGIATYALYSAPQSLSVPHPAVPSLIVNPLNKGWFTIGFLNPTTVGPGSVEIPSGHGFGRVRVLPNGNVRLNCVLSDGTPVTAGSYLSSTNEWPIFAKLPGRLGALSGISVFNAQLLDRDIGGTNLRWFRLPSRAMKYPSGWIDGVRVETTGSSYVAPDRRLAEGIFRTDVRTQPAPFLLSVGGSTASVGERYRFSLGVGSQVFLPTPNPQRFKLTMNSSSGLFTGSLLDSQTSVISKFRGALIQKGTLGIGFSEAAKIEIAPAVD
jgi:TolB protein